MSKRRRPPLILALRLLTVFALLLVAVAGLLYLMFRASLPKLEGEVRVPGLWAPVLVERDARGIPAIRAENREDLSRAIGFLHGQERFFRMDLQRRAGVGELSELFGERALDFDRSRRMLAGPSAVNEAFSRLPAKEKRLLQAYAEGVNAGLESLGSRPPEYWVLRKRPRPWRAEDSLAVALAMYHTLQYGAGEVALRQEAVRRRLPTEVAAFLESAPARFEAPLAGEVPSRPPLPVAAWAEALRDLEDKEKNGEVASWPGAGTGGVPGSNAWAAGPEHTANGRTLLANDPHLGLSVPNIWYRASFHYLGESGEAVEVHGVTLPGAPYMVIGSNRRVAWGLTNAYTQYLSLVRLDTDPERPGEYQTPDGWRAFGERRDQIRVAGRREPVEHVTLTTRWGSVLSVDFSGEERPEFAVIWVATRPYGLGGGMLAIESVGSVEEAMNVAWTSALPTQNVILADRYGSIGWTLGGPLGDIQGREQYGAVAGAEAEAIWGGPLPPERIPRILNPENGLLWSANQRKLRTPEGELLGDGGIEDDGRARRIRELLLAGGPFDERAFLEMQLDSRALFFDPAVERMLAFLDEEALREVPTRAGVRKLLSDYDGHADADSVGHSLLERWYRLYRKETLGHLLRPVVDLYPDFDLTKEPGQMVLMALLEDLPEELVPPPHADWRSFHLAMLDRAAVELAKEAGSLENATWGAVNRLRMSHPMGGMHSLLDRLLGMPSIPQSGSAFSPRVNQPAFGASMRMVVSPGHEEDGILHMPGGPSGHFLSPYFRIGHEAWAAGRPDALLPGPPRHRLQLAPPAER